MNTPKMDARQSVLDHYKVENGRIVSPGKFEGEPIYAPYFYEDSLNGGWDYVSPGHFKDEITKADRVAFPEIPKRKRVVHLYETDDGFVYIR
jgi:hypothetical protein